MRKGARQRRGVSGERKYCATRLCTPSWRAIGLEGPPELGRALSGVERPSFSLISTAAAGPAAKLQVSQSLRRAPPAKPLSSAWRLTFTNRALMYAQRVASKPPDSIACRHATSTRETREQWGLIVGQRTGHPDEFRLRGRQIGPSVADPQTVRDSGIEVHEEELGTVTAQRIYKMRCECGRSWFELELPKLVECPGCHKLGFVSA
jgi:hypothetical protein